MKDTKKSIAIMGGTFDPIHNGHLHVANSVIEAFALEKIIFMPTGNSPFKNKNDNRQHRLTMTELAIKDYKQFETSDIEISRQGTTFTIDTFREIKEKEQCKIYFIIGTDVLLSIYDFKEPLELFSICEFIVINRHGYSNGLIEKMRDDNAKVHILNIDMIDISSTKIRHMVSRNKPIGFYVPHVVDSYIKEKNLYKKDSKFDFDKATATLKENISPKRFTHIMGVCDTAIALAKHYKENEKSAHIAALLHDWAKEYSFEKLISVSEKYEYKIDSFIIQNLDLCHGFLAAEIASKDFDITDYDILNAIRYHTTGRANMSMLEKIVFIADATEPNRGESKDLEKLRELSYTNINQAMLLSLKFNFEKATKKRFLFHPFGLNALTYFHGIY